MSVLDGEAALGYEQGSFAVQMWLIMGTETYCPKFLLVTKRPFAWSQKIIRL